MRPYQVVSVKAAYFEDGVETPKALTWELSGADKNAYSYTVSDDEKSIELKCFGYSAAPLIIAAREGTSVLRATVILEGI